MGGNKQSLDLTGRGVGKKTKKIKTKKKKRKKKTKVFRQ